MDQIRFLRVVSFAALVIGLLSPVAVIEIENAQLKTAVAVLGWLCMLSLVFLVPVLALRSGKLTGRGSVTYRTKEPVRFWVGFTTQVVLVSFFAFLATLMFQGYWSTH